MRPYVWASVLSIALILAVGFAVGYRLAPLFASSALTVLLGVAHSALGERLIVQPILRLQGLPVVLGGTARTKGVIRYAWHLLSLTWWGLAGLMAYMAAVPATLSEPFLWMVVIVFGLSGAIVLAASRGRHMAWVLFLTAATLAGFAATGV